MILDKTIENLQSFGLDKEKINEMLTSKVYHLQCNEGNFYILDNKIYTGIDFYRIKYFERGTIAFPINCPDLIPTFYSLALSEYLNNKKKLLGVMYNELQQNKEFKKDQIQRTLNSIELEREYLKKNKHHTFKHKENAIEVYKSYIIFCESQPDQPQQTEIDIYKNSYSKKQFTDATNKVNPDKTKNTIYVGYVFSDVNQKQNKRVSENPTLSNEAKETLIGFNNRVFNFADDVIQLYKGVSKNDENTVNIQRNKIDFRLTSIKYFAKIAKFYQLEGKYSDAINIKDYCLLVFENTIANLKEAFSIDLFKTPLKTDLENVFKAFNDVINTDEVKVLIDVNSSRKEPQQGEAVKTKKIKKEVKFEDFFIKISTKQISDIKNKFNNLQGKDLAIFIHLCYNKFEILKIKQHDKQGFSAKNFVNLFLENKNYPAVNNHLNAEYKYNGNDKDVYNIDNELNTIISKS